MVVRGSVPKNGILEPRLLQEMSVDGRTQNALALRIELPARHSERGHRGGDPLLQGPLALQQLTDNGQPR